MGMIYSIGVVIKDPNRKRISKVIAADVDDAFGQATRTLFEKILGPYNKGGIPVTSGALKSSFSGIASQLGIDIDYSVAAYMVERYGPDGKVNADYLKSKMNTMPLATIVKAATAKATKWTVSTDVDYMFVNEVTNVFPNRRWQNEPPWNMFAGRAKTKTSILLRRLLKGIYTSPRLRKIAVRAYRYSSDSDAVSKLVSIGRELAEPFDVPI